MSDQQLAQAVRNSDLAVRCLCLGRTLNDQVRFLLRVVIQNPDVRIIQRQCLRFYPNQIFVDPQCLPFQVKVRNLQRKQLAHTEANEQIGQDRYALRFLHDLLHKNLHFRGTQNTHLLCDDLRPCCAQCRVARELVLALSVCEKVLEDHVMIANRFGGQSAVPPVHTRTVELFLLVIFLYHIRTDLIQEHFIKGRSKVRVVDV